MKKSRLTKRVTGEVLINNTIPITISITTSIKSHTEKAKSK